jgi:excisionase family DNA binding protein
MSTMQTTSGSECLSRDRQRAMSIDQFRTRYGVGRTTTYEEIKSGRLRARKCGKRTIITEDDAEAWLQRLPTLWRFVAVRKIH